MIRFCPNCHTERPLSELFCEGAVDGHRCDWNLLEVPMRAPGWRPAVVVTAEKVTPAIPVVPAPVGSPACMNGHPMDADDLICLTCGADPAVTDAAPAAAEDIPEALAAETVINGWRLLRQVSVSTGFRDRFLAEEEEGDRRAVLTLYHHGAEPDPEVYEAIRRLAFDHVPEIYATGRWNDRAYEVAEELTGGTLADLGIVAHDSVAIRRIVYELGKALNAFNEVGLRHRDLRPSTLLVRNRDPLDLVIGGFGSARLSEFDLDIVSPLEITSYMAPEAIAGGVAAASDWWSLGMILLEQITGGSCFEGINRHAFLIHVLANGVPIPDGLAPEIELLLRGLLARDRHQRWQWVQVQQWLDGQSPEAPPRASDMAASAQGPAIVLAGVSYRTAASYALAAAEPANWGEAREQLLRGVITSWAQEAGLSAQTLASLRQISSHEGLDEGFRLMLALKILNADMPLIFEGDIVTPKWLLDHPLEGYELISGAVPDLLERLGTERWLTRLKARETAVRARAHNLGIELDEDLLRINLLGTSRAKLAAEWEERRRLFPDSHHHGLLSLMERRTVSEEDLIVVLSATIGLFRSCEGIVDEAQKLANEVGVQTFERELVSEMTRWPRGEVLQLVAERIEGFARCGVETVDGWGDRFRLERRLPLAQALVLVSVPSENWQEPQKQQYLSQILGFFEKKITASVMRGPLVRMTIGKTTPRVDLSELGTPRLDPAALLDHLLLRNERALALDPAWLTNPASTVEQRLQSLHRQTALYKRDTGIDGLYLGFPFLLLRDARSTSRTRIAPLLLWPVRMHVEVGMRGAVSLAFDNDREEVRLNPALEGLVGAEQAKQWRQVVDELLGRSALRAADVIDALGALAAPRLRTLESLPGAKTELTPQSSALVSSAVLFHLTFIGQAIGEDLRNLQQLRPNGTGLETALRLNNTANDVAKPAMPVREIDRYFTVHSDPSQEEAVLLARDVPGRLIEGPPGTGKSQTIVNMVGDAIGRRRSMLIVCQKHAALEVVYKRLVAEGLGNRIIMVNDVNRDRNPVIRAVREQIEELVRRSHDAAAPIRRKRDEIAARIEALEGILDRHHEALHQIDEHVGISYRALLGELICLESPAGPIDVPALRPLLSRLTTGALAALEEACAPLARYWLPACYEGSALSILQAFTPDPATLADFHEAFDTFRMAEVTRADVLLTQPAPFEVDDPAPHRAWLTTYGDKFLALPDATRLLLAKWLPLFREAASEMPKGLDYLKQLATLRETLTTCNEADFSEKLSVAASALEPAALDTLYAYTVETCAPLRWIDHLNFKRHLRRRLVNAFLIEQGAIPDAPHVARLKRVLELERQWRPLRKALGELHQALQLPAIASDAGPTLLKDATASYELLHQVAELASLLAKAPWPDRVDAVAKSATHSAFLSHFAEYDAAFARHAARTASRQALARLEGWTMPEWFVGCGYAINDNEPNLARIAPIESALPTLAAYQQFRGRAERLSEQELAAFAVLRGKEEQLRLIHPTELEGETRRILNREARLGWKRVMEQASPDLEHDREDLESKVAMLAQLDREMRELNRQLLREDYDLAQIRPLREWEDITRLTGQRARRLREFIDRGASLGLMKLRPVWLMNPDVASRVLPLKAQLFDTVIYDEASQMPVEYALPSLFRAGVCVVSGDEKQMPPTAFFSGRVESDEGQVFDGVEPDEDASEEEQEAFDETWNRREIKDCPDLLQLARGCLPASRLAIHYRSAYRELIGYSNSAFYGNHLHVPVRHPESTVQAVKPIELVEGGGTYHEQTNLDEAERVVDILSDIWRKPRDTWPSVGVVTFNRKQADLIEERLEARAELDEAFREAYRLECERVEDGEDMGVFVKNVENVQGDERDVIVFSSTFGRNRQGSFLRSFGVLGQKGGERRLNVAVTRSRQKVVMVTSMPIDDISDLLSTHRPPATPRDYLQGYMAYARAVSTGQLGLSRSLLQRWTVSRDGGRGHTAERVGDGFTEAVSAYVRSLGFTVSESIENDVFGLDFAVEHPQTGLFAIGIECDAPRHDLLDRARAREVWRPNVLRRAVPMIHRVSSQAWYGSGDAERLRLQQAIEKALQMEVVQ